MREATRHPAGGSKPRHLPNLPVDRRDAIVAVAATEFVERGFERASMNRIIATTGVSKGSMYHFFESKAELFAVAASTAIERVEREVGAPPSACTTVEEFRDGFRTWYRRLLAHLVAHRGDDALLEVLRAVVSVPNPPAPALRCAAEIGSWYDGLFEELASLGVLRDDIPVDILAGATERATLALDRWFIDESRSNPSRLEEFAGVGTDLFMRLVTSGSHT